jgi:cytochrome c
VRTGSGSRAGALMGGATATVAIAIAVALVAGTSAPVAAQIAPAAGAATSPAAGSAAPAAATPVRRPTTPELDARGLALTKERGCTACHATDGKRVGPGFAQIAARYRADPEADARIPQKIRNGSVGTWGRVIMPRQGQVTEEEAKVLGAWVLSR